MRGKRGKGQRQGLRARSIPAHAGETPGSATSAPALGVHPRTCGGNELAWNTVIPRHGPSPHMRGKLIDRERCVTSQRSIPAHAGETREHGRRTIRNTVHPRTCGGNVPIPGTKHGLPGPSPHMRGKPQRRPYHLGTGRSIPAHAGETTSCPTLPDNIAVHPRTCGGNGLQGDRYIREWGPSPHMRGKPTSPARTPGRTRSIPAHAGETLCSRVRTCHLTVHPRTCGGNMKSWLTPPWIMGPSPHMRGKPQPQVDARIRSRSIPAHAGETLRVLR